MNKPRYVKVNGKLYKINTDFRQAIEVEKIVRDDTIGDFEKMLAIVYTLFGEEGLNSDDVPKLLEKRNGIYYYGYRRKTR